MCICATESRILRLRCVTWWYIRLPRGGSSSTEVLSTQNCQGRKKFHRTCVLLSSINSKICRDNVPVNRFVEVRNFLVVGRQVTSSLWKAKRGFMFKPSSSYPDFGTQFILTTDGSRTAVAAILSQVQNGVERPISYASKQLIRAEGN